MASANDGPLSDAFEETDFGDVGFAFDGNYSSIDEVPALVASYAITRSRSAHLLHCDLPRWVPLLVHSRLSLSRGGVRSPGDILFQHRHETRTRFRTGLGGGRRIRGRDRDADAQPQGGQAEPQRAGVEGPGDSGYGMRDKPRHKLTRLSPRDVTTHTLHGRNLVGLSNRIW